MKVKAKKMLASFVAAATAFMCAVVAVPKIEVSAAEPLAVIQGTWSGDSSVRDRIDGGVPEKIVISVSVPGGNGICSAFGGGGLYGLVGNDSVSCTINDLEPHDLIIEPKKGAAEGEAFGWYYFNVDPPSDGSVTINTVTYIDAEDNVIETKTVGKTLSGGYGGSKADIAGWDSERAAAITKAVFNIDFDYGTLNSANALTAAVTADEKTITKTIGCMGDPDSNNIPDYSETDYMIESTANNNIEIDLADGITGESLSFSIRSHVNRPATVNSVKFLDSEGNVVYQLPAVQQPDVPVVPVDPEPEEPTPEEPEPVEPAPVESAPAVPEVPTETIPDDGTVTVEPTVVGEGAPDTIVDDASEVKAAVALTPEEKAAVEAGADVKITLSVEKADTTAAPEEKAAIEEAAPENFEVGIFLDIRLDKQVGNLAKKAVSNLLNKIKITVDIPVTLVNTDDTVNREYVVIHRHNGSTEVIPAFYDTASKKLTFLTDKFSTYAIAYKDTPKAAEAEPAVPVYSVTVDGNAAVTGDRTAGSEMTVTVPFGMTARVYSGTTLIATLRNSGKFTMPAGDVKVIVTDESGAGMIASTAPNSYIFSYDSSMKLIKTTRSKKGISGTGEITVNLGADYAGKKVTLYSGKKSTSEKLEEAVLDSKGSAAFIVKGAKNYTLVVED